MTKRHKVLERLNLVYFLLNCTQELNILTFIYYHYYHNLNSLYNNFKSIRLYILFSNFKKERKKESEVAQSCPTLCHPMDSSLYQAPLSMGFSRQEYCSGLPFPSPFTNFKSLQIIFSILSLQ